VHQELLVFLLDIPFGDKVIVLVVRLLDLRLADVTIKWLYVGVVLKEV
jgi:hypothetical protein